MTEIRFPGGTRSGGRVTRCSAGTWSDMFALLSARFRRLLYFMIAVPLGGRLLDAAGRRLEATGGPTRLSRALRSGGQAAGRVSRGPLRSRYGTAADGTAPGQPGPAGLGGPGRRRRGRR